jgi:hypothetical protein
MMRILALVLGIAAVLLGGLWLLQARHHAVPLWPR